MPIIKYLYDNIDLIIAGFTGFMVGGFFGIMTMALMVGARKGEDDANDDI